MTTAKLTEMMVARLAKPGQGRREIFDEALPAFGLRVTWRRVKSWFLMTRIEGKLVRLTLGRFPGLGLVKARQAARDQLNQIANWRDPRSARPSTAPRA